MPIIENTPFEEDLTDSLARAIEEYPETCAVLVRRHGVYVWGDTWQQAKTMYVIFIYFICIMLPVHFKKTTFKHFYKYLLIKNNLLIFSPQNRFF